MRRWAFCVTLALAACAGAQVVTDRPAASSGPDQGVVIYEIGSSVPADLERRSVLGYSCEEMGDPQHNIFLRGALVDRALDQGCAALQFLGARYERIPGGRRCTFEAACLSKPTAGAR